MKEGISNYLDSNGAYNQDSQAWYFMSWASFVISFGMMVLGIVFLPVDGWIKAFLAVGYLFSVSSNFVLSKTVRDHHEQRKFINQIKTAKTQKILQDYELKD